ncbi:MAG: carbohydrate kinase, partial [Dehalococcoidia bacterium]|nr:carbohydrate kinase [Dehalococcoidia bacterium]
MTFAAVQAQRLGIDAGVVTVAEPSLDLPNLLAGVAIAVREDGVTQFENVYIDGRRAQYVRAQAEPLALDDIPAGWRKAPVALVGPVCGET